MYVIVKIVFHLFFFFSSRRRHTRLQGDWSSDVCSSDLDAGRARSRHRRRDRGLPPLPAQGPQAHGREPPLAPPDVRVPAEGGSPRPGVAVRRRARPASARLDGLARLPAPRRRQVRGGGRPPGRAARDRAVDRKSTRLNSSHLVISYAVFCLKKKQNTTW